MKNLNHISAQTWDLCRTLVRAELLGIEKIMKSLPLTVEEQTVHIKNNYLPVLKFFLPSLEGDIEMMDEIDNGLAKLKSYLEENISRAPELFSALLCKVEIIGKLTYGITSVYTMQIACEE